MHVGSTGCDEATVEPWFRIVDHAEISVGTQPRPASPAAVQGGRRHGGAARRTRRNRIRRRSDPEELATALGALRPIARETSGVILAQEVEHALARLMRSGGTTSKTSRHD